MQHVTKIHPIAVPEIRDSRCRLDGLDQSARDRVMNAITWQKLHAFFKHFLTPRAQRLDEFYVTC